MLSKFFSWVKTLLKRLIDWFKDSKKKEDEEVLKKELLLCGGKGANVFKITVAKLTSTLSFQLGLTCGYNTTKGISLYKAGGAISPSSSSELGDIYGVVSETISGSLGVYCSKKLNAVYIKRLDTGASAKLTYKADASTSSNGHIATISPVFFTETDVGKTIDIILKPA